MYILLCGAVDSEAVFQEIAVVFSPQPLDVTEGCTVSCWRGSAGRISRKWQCIGCVYAIYLHHNIKSFIRITIHDNSRRSQFGMVFHCRPLDTLQKDVFPRSFWTSVDAVSTSKFTTTITILKVNHSSVFKFSITQELFFNPRRPGFAGKAGEGVEGISDKGMIKEHINLTTVSEKIKKQWARFETTIKVKPSKNLSLPVFVFLTSFLVLWTLHVLLRF